MDMIWWYFVAAGAGWAFDDFCGTPPRKGPIGPGPWWIRKILAAAGGVGMFALAGPQLGEPATIIGAALLGGIGGVVLASIGGAVMGGKDVAGG
ncbi:MAG TPA: hypothetical protein VJS15_06980 [Allosphingosinicella sp.]|nr:hypothetical protein [Allosphingosinicella sp.]